MRAIVRVGLLLAALAFAAGQSGVFPPGQMLPPGIVDLGETYVTLNWTLPPVLGSHPIIYFSLEQSDGDSGLFRSIALPTVFIRNTTITKLTAGYFYQFRISASMEVPGRGIITGPVSEPTDVATIPSVPATPIVREKSTTRTSSTCTVQWTIAFDGGKPIDRFIVERSGVANYTLAETWVRYETVHTLVTYDKAGLGIGQVAYNLSQALAPVHIYPPRTRRITTGIDLTNYHLRFNGSQVTVQSNWTTVPAGSGWTALATLPAAPAGGWPAGATNLQGYERRVVEARWTAAVSDFVYDEAAFRVHTTGLNEFVTDTSGTYSSATAFLRYTFERLVHGKTFQVRVSAVNSVGRSGISLPKPISTAPAAGEVAWTSSFAAQAEADGWRSHNNSCRLRALPLELGEGAEYEGSGAALVGECRPLAPELAEPYRVPVAAVSVDPSNFLAASPVALGSAVAGIGEVQWERHSRYLVLVDSAPLDEDPSEIAYLRAPLSLLESIAANNSYGGYLDYALHLLRPEGLTGGIEGYEPLRPLPAALRSDVPALNGSRLPPEMHDVLLIAGGEPRAVRKWAAPGFLGGDITLSWSAGRDPSVGGPAGNETDYYPPECAGTDCVANFVVHLREDGGWLDWETGAAPTRTRFQAALASIRDIYIRADYWRLVTNVPSAVLGTGESYLFDAVVLTQGTMTLPITWHAFAPTANLTILLAGGPPGE